MQKKDINILIEKTNHYFCSHKNNIVARPPLLVLHIFISIFTLKESKTGFLL